MVGIGNTSIDRGVQQDLTDLFGIHTCAQGRSDVHIQLAVIATAVKIAMVSKRRSVKSRPSRCQISPHAVRVMKSWNFSVTGVIFSTEESTCASPKTARRLAMPTSWAA